GTGRASAWVWRRAWGAGDPAAASGPGTRPPAIPARCNPWARIVAASAAPMAWPKLRAVVKNPFAAPRSWGGTAPSTALLLGGWNIPPPAPATIRQPIMRGYEAGAPSRDIPSTPMLVQIRPAVLTRRALDAPARRPTTWLEIVSASDRGAMSKPAEKGDRPSATW